MIWLIVRIGVQCRKVSPSVIFDHAPVLGARMWRRMSCAADLGFEVPCYSPLTVWEAKERNPSGKRSMVFSAAKALQPDDPKQISCGQCIGCRLERSRQWAIRCVHEASLYTDNVFLTLTFSEEALWNRDNPYSLDVTEHQKFIKRLRKARREKIRFLHCGEYGDCFGRPHYHYVIFNCKFSDSVLYTVRNGQGVYVSRELSELWPFGFATIGSVTFESAAYVARYCMKKVTGDLADEHYNWIDERTGEWRPRVPEYVTMSRRPGVGRPWFEKFKGDCYPKDWITINGIKMPIPRFYDKLLEELAPYELDDIKAARVERALEHYDDNVPERLKAREECKRKKLKLLPRLVE